MRRQNKGQASSPLARNAPFGFEDMSRALADVRMQQAHYGQPLEWLQAPYVPGGTWDLCIECGMKFDITEYVFLLVVRRE